MTTINSREQLIKAYIDFFKSKNHKEIPNSPLVPANDPTVLFTTAGMHPLVPFLLGQPHPLGKRLVNIQRCIRTTDIDRVGNTTHHTFFEMLGNWSVGDYFKEDAIKMSFEFLTKVLKMPKEKLGVTCFKGDKDAPKDEEASEIWQELGIKKEHIEFCDKDGNWWGPAGETGPCGPDTEMHYWVGKENPPKNFESANKTWVEIWNDVFMQYNKNKSGIYEQSKQKNVDTGMGTERVLAVLNNYTDNYLTEIWQPLIKKIEKLSNKKYGEVEKVTKAMRIIADHIKASVMILGEKVVPSNTERGYVLRRLIRRAIRYAKFIGINEKFTKVVAEQVFPIYKDYSHLEKNKEFILKELESEETAFEKTIEQGIKYFEKLKLKDKVIDGKTAFLLYQSYGFPIEMTQELARENNLEVNMIEYEQEQATHQKLSQTSSAGVFKAGLADSSEIATKYHTATHLLLSALKQVLKQEIEQRGSNITAERLRFDFSFDRKLEDKELKAVESLINENIKKGLEVKREVLSLQEAKKSGATGIFEDKYGEKVSVYTICDIKSPVSKEICSGPHVTNTKDLGKFKIIKEEASSRGVRRIKAILTD